MRRFDYGVPIPVPGRPVSDNEEQEIVASYRTGAYGYRTLAARHAISVERVKKVLARHGMAHAHSDRKRKRRSTGGVAP